MKKIKFDSPNLPYWSLSKAYTEIFKHLRISKGKMVKLAQNGNIPSIRYRSRYIFSAHEVIVYASQVIEEVKRLNKKYGQKEVRTALVKMNQQKNKSKKFLIKYLDARDERDARGENLI